MTKVKRNKVALWGASLCAFGLVAGLAACAPQSATDAGGDASATSNAKLPQQEGTPAADEYGVVTAEAWKDVYPYQYSSYMRRIRPTPASTTTWSCTWP